MKRYSLYILVLANLLFPSHDELDSLVANYGFEWDSKRTEYISAEINNLLNIEISSILHPDNFIIQIKSEIEFFFLKDSNYVSAPKPESESQLLIGYYDDFQSYNGQRLSQGQRSNNKIKSCLFPEDIMFSSEPDFSLHLAYKPIITILIEKILMFLGFL